jgi:hypothetical protein
MSIVALKRKTHAQQSLSGKNPEATLVVHGPGQTRTITTGGGFSLNGRHRNIGRVGANQLFSKGGSKMVAGTTQLRGWGGTLGTYVGQEQNQTWKQHRCCGSNNTPVHTSTLNTKGMLALKNKWKKTPIPASVFEAAGRAPPTDPSQLETIFNNWVATEQTGNMVTGSSGQRTQNISRRAAVCVDLKDAATHNAKAACGSNDPPAAGFCGYHIEGKYIPPTPFSKRLPVDGNDAGRAIARAIDHRAAILPRGYDKPFPYTTPANSCHDGAAAQVSDPVVLRSYYADANNVDGRCPERCTTYTLLTRDEAIAQGGLRDCQHLVLTQADYVQQGNDVFGLRIANGQTFTVAPTATITFADPIAPAGNAVGIQVETGGTFIQQGGAITFRGDITGDADTHGIFNNNGGTFRQEGGAITFEGAITAGGTGAAGIFNGGTFTQTGGAITFQRDITGAGTGTFGIRAAGTFSQTGGAITFRGDITGTATGTFGILVDVGTFTQAGGAITFRGDITGAGGGGTIGIYNNDGAFTQQGGAITFEGAITNTNTNTDDLGADGIANRNGAFSQTAGAITFRGAITSANTQGIFNGNGTFSQAGAITFEGLLEANGGNISLVVNDNGAPGSFAVNGAIAFPGTEYVPANFVPTTAATPSFTGNGTITYNNDNPTPDTYYRAP